MWLNIFIFLPPLGSAAWLAKKGHEGFLFLTFYILVSGKVVTKARVTIVKMSIHYLYARCWDELRGFRKNIYFCDSKNSN